jgi:ABC-type transport system involved in multi-copper enzyme maturation permease subunit
LIVLRYLPYVFVDRLSRAVVALGAGVLLVAPFASASVDGPATGLTILSLAVACVLIWDGLVSGERRAGFARLLFSRPVHPAAYYTAVHAVAIACIVAVAVLLGGAIGLVGEAGALHATASSTAIALRTARAALVAAGVVGSLTFALSALMPRGEGIASAAVLVAAASLPRIAAGLPYADVISGTLGRVLPPVTRMTEIQAGVLSGSELMPGGWPLVAGWSVVVFGVGLWAAVLKDLDPPG